MRADNKAVCAEILAVTSLCTPSPGQVPVYSVNNSVTRQLYRLISTTQTHTRVLQGRLRAEPRWRCSIDTLQSVAAHSGVIRVIDPRGQLQPLYRKLPLVSSDTGDLNYKLMLCFYRENNSKLGAASIPTCSFTQFQMGRCKHSHMQFSHEVHAQNNVHKVIFQMGNICVKVYMCVMLIYITSS